MKAELPKRNPVAKAVRTPQFRMRVVRNTKAYDRKRQVRVQYA